MKILTVKKISLIAVIFWERIDIKSSLTLLLMNNSVPHIYLFV